MRAMPITLFTASLLALLMLFLAYRIVVLRVQHKVSTGDGGHEDLALRVRSFGNLVEYAPMLLILMALVEAANGSLFVLGLIATLFVLARIAHPIGLHKPPPNIFRSFGIFGTWGSLLILAIYGLTLSARALTPPPPL